MYDQLGSIFLSNPKAKQKRKDKMRQKSKKLLSSSSALIENQNRRSKLVTQIQVALENFERIH